MKEDFHLDKMEAHLELREWNGAQIDGFVRMVGNNALMSYQTVNAVLEYQQAVDEQIAAEKKCDEVFMSRRPDYEKPATLPLSFFEDTQGDRH